VPGLYQFYAGVAANVPGTAGHQNSHSKLLNLTNAEQ
jgi:hypothetical protein